MLDFIQGGKATHSSFGVTYKETVVIFDKVEGSPLNLVGKAKGLVLSGDIKLNN